MNLSIQRVGGFENIVFRLGFKVKFFDWRRGKKSNVFQSNQNAACSMPFHSLQLKLHLRLEIDLLSISQFDFPMPRSNNHLFNKSFYQKEVTNHDHLLVHGHQPVATTDKLLGPTFDIRPQPGDCPAPAD